MTSLNEVTVALAGLGIPMAFDDKSNIWTLRFELSFGSENVISPCSLVFPNQGDYLIALSAITLGVPMESVPPSILLLMLRLQSDVLLAKVDVWAGPPSSYFALSPCSMVGVTGDKLRKRMEACALLAASINRALAGL